MLTCNLQSAGVEESKSRVSHLKLFVVLVPAYRRRWIAGGEARQQGQTVDWQSLILRTLMYDGRWTRIIIYNDSASLNTVRMLTFRITQNWGFTQCPFVCLFVCLQLPETHSSCKSDHCPTYWSIRHLDTQIAAGCVHKVHRQCQSRRADRYRTALCLLSS